MDIVEIAAVSIGSIIFIYFMVAISYRMRKEGYPRKAKQDARFEAQMA